jgi:hypothetical protein
MNHNDWLRLSDALADAASRSADDARKCDAASAMWPIHYGNTNLLIELSKVAKEMASHMLTTGR